MSDATENLWRDLELSAKLYQFYLGIVLKLNAFAYGITGGILSFCLTKTETEYTIYVLFFPLVMSLFLGVLLGYSSLLAKYLRDDVSKTCEKLGILDHEFSPLVYTLRIFAVLHFLTAAGIGFVVSKIAA